MLYICEIFGNIFINKWNNRNTMTFIKDLSHTWHYSSYINYIILFFPYNSLRRRGLLFIANVGCVCQIDFEVFFTQSFIDASFQIEETLAP